MGHAAGVGNVSVGERTGPGAVEEEAASKPIVTPAVRICRQYAFTDYSEVIQPPLSVLHAALLSVPYRADDPHQM